MPAYLRMSNDGVNYVLLVDVVIKGIMTSLKIQGVFGGWDIVLKVCLPVIPKAVCMHWVYDVLISFIGLL